jgi:ArsR family transcriptional regulator
VRDTAVLFRAIGDETRLQMLWLLMNHRELCVCDFMEVLQITQSKASRHLRNLFHAGLVTDRREGLWVYYSLRSFDRGLVPSVLRALETSLAEEEQARAVLARLDRWLAEKTPPCRCDHER